MIGVLSFDADGDQIIDLLGLMGDAVDNIPGVPGIGPKTASTSPAPAGSGSAITTRICTAPEPPPGTVPTL